MLDTLEIFRELKQNFSEEQASSLSKLFRETIESHIETLSTKRDLKELDTGLRRDMKEIEARLQHEIKELETGLKREMTEVKVDIIKWVVGLMLVQSGIIVGGFFTAVKMLIR